MPGPARQCRPRLEGLEGRIVPATFHVNDVTGLYAAIATVNANRAEKATIFLEQGTYALTSGELLVQNASNLTIQGNALGKVIIDGGNATRDFEIDGGNVTLFGLTVTGGNAIFLGDGGGILAHDGATLNVDRCDFTNNHAGVGGAIRTVASTVNVDLSDFTGNSANSALPNGLKGGGAIAANGGTVNVDLSDFTGNNADNAIGGGGAILVDSGTLNVDRSNFTGNHAVTADLGGGAILTDESTVNVTHSNITGNHAEAVGPGGGGMRIFGGAQAEIDFSTISGNTTTFNGTIPSDLDLFDVSAHLKETVVGTTRYHDTTLAPGSYPP